MVHGSEGEVETRTALSLEEGDLREYLSALPTRNDMEAFVQCLEQGYHKELQFVKAELRATGAKTVGLKSLDVLMGSLQSQEQRMDTHEVHIHTLFQLLEDQDNRNRRNNIRIRGVPEVSGTEDLMPIVKKIFNSCWKRLRHQI